MFDTSNRKINKSNEVTDKNTRSKDIPEATLFSIQFKVFSWVEMMNQIFVDDLIPLRSCSLYITSLFYV